MSIYINIIICFKKNFKFNLLFSHLKKKGNFKMHQNNMISILQQQKKIINYLQEQHLKNTGYEVSLPQSWSEFLGLKPISSIIIF